MDKELVFYTNPQSRGAIVHWMLEEIGCPYTLKVLEYGTSMKAPEYLSINPMGKVPAIRHGNEVVTETAAICAYLADAFPEAGLAPEPAQRSSYYRWLFFTAGCVEPAMSNHAVGWDPDPAMQGRFGYGSFERTFDTLATWLKDRRFIAGDKFTAADVYVASVIDFGMKFNIIPKRPEFETYVEPLVSWPARQRVEELIEKLLTQKAPPST